MNLALPVRLGFIFSVFAAVPLLYNNCSEMKFEDGQVPSLAAASDGAVDPLNPVSDPATDPVTDLPEAEQDIFRPISDLESDPNLNIIYRCDTDSVSLCHFPNNTDAAHTLCVGLSAVESHQAHEVQLTEVGNVAVLSDYLGPCKH